MRLADVTARFRERYGDGRFTTALAPSLAEAAAANRSAASVLVQFEPGGRVTVASGSQDLGTATYTIMAQAAAATLNLRTELIDARLGDSTLPEIPVPGESQIHAAARQAQLKLLTTVAADTGSPLHGAQPDELEFKNGRIMRKGQPESGESFNAFLAATAIRRWGLSSRPGSQSASRGTCFWISSH